MPSASLRRTYEASTSVFAGAFIRRAPSLDRRGGLRLLAQGELLDLAGRSLRQRAEDHGPRCLEPREVRAAVLDDLLGGRGHARLELDERARRLAPLRIGL